MNQGLLRYLYKIDEYFYKSMTEMIKEDNCLPYLVNVRGEIADVVDFTRRIPDDLRKYDKLVLEAVAELDFYGMFDKKKQRRAYLEN